MRGDLEPFNRRGDLEPANIRGDLEPANIRGDLDPANGRGANLFADGVAVVPDIVTSSFTILAFLAVFRVLIKLFF
jgi:hypothetical protein